MLAAGARQRRDRRAARCRSSRSRRSASSSRDPQVYRLAVDRLGVRAERDRLPVVQRLGRPRRRLLRPAPGLDQPLRRAGRAPAGQRPSTSCGTCRACPGCSAHERAAARSSPTRGRGRAPAHGIVRQTPLLESDALNELVGGRLLSRRNVCSAPARSSSAAPTTPSASSTAQPVVAYSSGNHAQGVAAAARLLGVPATIVMPADAPAIKIDNTRALGAEVRLYDREREVREEIGAEIAAAHRGGPGQALRRSAHHRRPGHRRAGGRQRRLRALGRDARMRRCFPAAAAA